MATRKASAGIEPPREWLKAREEIADAAEQWATSYAAAHHLPATADLLDALAEAYEAGAAAARRAEQREARSSRK